MDYHKHERKRNKVLQAHHEDDFEGSRNTLWKAWHLTLALQYREEGFGYRKLLGGEMVTKQALSLPLKGLQFGKDIKQV